MRFAVVICKWDGECFRPIERHHNIARGQFNAGEEYPLEVREERSSKSHAHYFAAVNEAWSNLSEESRKAFRTAEDLRQWALIETGWSLPPAVIDYGTEEAARKMAALSRASYPSYVEIWLRKNEETGLRSVLVIKVARSQSRRSMNKQEFEQSKRDVLDLLAGAINVRRSDLEREGRLRAS